MLLLLAPMIPLLFMGDEVAAQEPFLFFTSHQGELAEAVRQGRRDEFAAFGAFADTSERQRIPDPNAQSTFQASLPSHDGEQAEATRELYRELLRIRHRELAPRLPGSRALGAEVLAEGALTARWRLGDGSLLRIDLNLSAHRVEMQPGADAQPWFQHPPGTLEHWRQGWLPAFSALVQLQPATVLDGER